MKVAGVWAVAREGRAVAETLRRELSHERAGPVFVSGMLAEQLARELAAGAEAGSVVVDGPRPGAAAVVRIIAGEPSVEDEAVVREADALLVPVVIVQLWPQADWTPPFVLAPFVVECRTGEGFPLGEIADRLVEAVEGASLLAARVPVLRASFDRSAVRGTALRSAWLGLTAASVNEARPLLVLEQTRMLARLRTASAGAATADPSPVLAGAIASLIASGFALRVLALQARRVLPTPLADTAVAVGGTLLLARGLRLLESRLLH